MIAIPDLPHNCNSWIVVRKDTGEPIGEFYNRRNVARFNPETCEVYTALAWLQRLNKGY